MGVRRPWLVLAALLIPVGADASDHRFGIFVAPSYLLAKGSTSHLGGWHTSGEATLKKERRLAFVGDLSVHFFGSDGDKDLTQITFMAGTRWSFLGGGKHLPSVHFMAFGAAHSNDGNRGVSTSAGAISFGAAYDFVRTKKGPWGVRAQGDYIVPLASGLKNSLRVSVGWVYRFHEASEGHGHAAPPTGPSDSGRK